MHNYIKSNLYELLCYFLHFLNKTYVIHIRQCKLSGAIYLDNNKIWNYFGDVFLFDNNSNMIS